MLGKISCYYPEGTIDTAGLVLVIRDFFSMQSHDYFLFQPDIPIIFNYSKESCYTTEETDQDITLLESNIGTMGNVY